MKKDILAEIKHRRLFFDGGTGTVLQQMGVLRGEAPEILNIKNPDAVRELHKKYVDAGANIIKTNTFGINSLKYKNYRELIRAGVSLAADAAGDGAYVAFDVGPLGRMLKPLGDLDFEEAVSVFKNSIAEASGCDLILIETMSDMYETKAAVLAAKEASNLPVFVTFVLDKSGKMMTGASPEAMIAMLEGMGVCALGMNCSIGPWEMEKILPRFIKSASVPIIVNANAGLPVYENGETKYDIGASEFAECAEKMAKMGASIIGGCCGTTPEFIKTIRARVENVPYAEITQKNKTVISSYTEALEIDGKPIIVGERINPTGKPKLKEALRENNISYILEQAQSQVDDGAHALDVNVGLPDIDEAEMIEKIVFSLQSVIDLPLQIDSGNPIALERAMRVYNGKPLVNSVSGKQEIMDAVFPLVKKYGGVLIALTMDEGGIPETADGRIAIAEKIIAEAKRYGLCKKDIIFDPLTLTVASGKDNARVTLECVSRLTEAGYKTSLGVSNVSFGLPERDIINSAFFSMALKSGLTMAIINPHSKHMMNAYYSYGALLGADEGCKEYIDNVAGLLSQAGASAEKSADVAEKTLASAIERGMKESAAAQTGELLCKMTGEQIINGEIIPALNAVGEKYEKGALYLPALLMAAEAASASFNVIKDKTEKKADNGKVVIIATVKGDIHDIGKNIVKLLMESYGYSVVDLGKDVSEETLLSEIEGRSATFVALSALMTTTVVNMESAIRAIRSRFPEVKIMVGGAVLTASYAKKIGADYYAADAVSAVRCAEEHFFK